MDNMIAIAQWCSLTSCKLKH